MRRYFYVVLTLKFRKEGDQWLAYCEELGTSTFADSMEEADRHLREAILLHLNTLEDVGECERFFAENNIKLHKHEPKGPDLQLQGPFRQDTYTTPYIHPIHKELFGCDPR